MRIALHSLLLLITILVAGVSAQQPADAPLKLLDQVAKHYQDAESVHLEATVHNSFRNDLTDQQQTSMFTVYVASGSRFRYDGTDYGASGLIVSDGTTEWRLLRGFAKYAKEPSGTFFASPVPRYGDDRPIFYAQLLLQNLMSLGTRLRSAHFSPSESLKVNGRKVRCTVVHFGNEDWIGRPMPSGTAEETFVWIDPTSLTVLKEELREHNRPSYGMEVPPFGRSFDEVHTTTYSVVNLDFKPKPDTFTFIPPAGSTEVATLPNPFPDNSAVNASKGPSISEKIAAAHLGKPLPRIVLRDATGAVTPLISYTGHPLLIDVWATWCGPCINELPALNRIRKSTSQTDLQMIAVDEDDKSADAVELLKRRGYDWKDFHFNHAVNKELSISGLPFIVLADATGKIVYSHNGAGDEKGLATAISKLGKEYESVRID